MPTIDGFENMIPHYDLIRNTPTSTLFVIESRQISIDNSMH